MKFSQVNDVQIQQSNEAVAVISKLRKKLAEQKLIKSYLKLQCSGSAS